MNTMNDNKCDKCPKSKQFIHEDQKTKTLSIVTADQNNSYIVGK